MKIYRYFVDFTRKGSINYKLRQHRLKMFLSQISHVRKPVRILDVGGSKFYWNNLFFNMPDIQKKDYQITITNTSDSEANIGNVSDDCYSFLKLDARYMHDLTDGEFDVVHSNSVIEHVGGFDEQLKMAIEIRRVGKRHFVQTPNYYFPVEPHFQTLFFHWLPKPMRIFLVKRFALGHLPRAANDKQAAEIVDSAQLLRLRDLEKLFPESIIHREKIFGLTKSFIVVGKS